LELLASFQGITRAVAVPYRDERLTQRNRIISLVYDNEKRPRKNGGSHTAKHVLHLGSNCGWRQQERAD